MCAMTSSSFGYRAPRRLTALSDAQFADVVELDAKAWSRHRFDPKTLQQLADPTVTQAQRLPV